MPDSNAIPPGSSIVKVDGGYNVTPPGGSTYFITTLPPEWAVLEGWPADGWNSIPAGASVTQNPDGTFTTVNGSTTVIHDAEGITIRATVVLENGSYEIELGGPVVYTPNGRAPVTIYGDVPPIVTAGNVTAITQAGIDALANIASNMNACNTALGPLVSACAYAKETIQSALDTLNYIAGIIQTGRDTYTHNGGATHDACYSPWTSLSSQLTPDLLAVQADLQAATDAWSYWQSFDCAWYHASAPADQGQSVRDTVNAAMSDALAKLGAWQDTIAAMRDDDCAFAGLDDLVTSMPNGWTPPPKQHESGDPGGP